MSIERGNSDSYIREKAEKRSRWLLLILAIPLVLSLPLFLGSYFTYLFNLIGIYVIIAVGLNILTGYAGQISLGHAALVAFGAYSSALLVTRLHIPFLVAIPTAGLISSLAGLVVAIPALRLRGFYLAIATMAFSFIIAEMI
ncbi:MAG: branched-chain amino acid ABC transporter permease, partial [Thermodesulfobacteriota bacterium]